MTTKTLKVVASVPLLKKGNSSPFSLLVLGQEVRRSRFSDVHTKILKYKETIIEHMLLNVIEVNMEVNFS